MFLNANVCNYDGDIIVHISGDKLGTILLPGSGDGSG